MSKDIRLTQGVNNLTTNVIGKNDQQAIHNDDVRYEHENKCANAITNKGYVYEVRSPRPTSPLLTSRRSPLSQPGFLRSPEQRLHLTIQALCNHTSHLSVGPSPCPPPQVLGYNLSLGSSTDATPIGFDPVSRLTLLSVYKCITSDSHKRRLNTMVCSQITSENSMKLTLTKSHPTTHTI